MKSFRTGDLVRFIGISGKRYDGNGVTEENDLRGVYVNSDMQHFLRDKVFESDPSAYIIEYSSRFASRLQINSKRSGTQAGTLPQECLNPTKTPETRRWSLHTINSLQRR